MAQLPLSPRLSHMLLKAAERGAAETGATLAALLSEAGLGGKSSDLDTRLEALGRDRTPKVTQARQLAEGWARQAQSLVKPVAGRVSPKILAHNLLAQAFPERVAKARASGKRGEFVMRNGRGVYVDEHDPLAGADYLAVGDLGGGSNRDRVLLGAALTEAEVVALFTDQIVSEVVAERNGGKLRAFEQQRLGALVLSAKPMTSVPASLLAKIEAEEIRSKGLQALKFSDAAKSLRARVGFLRSHDDSWPDMGDEALLSMIDDWLSPYAAGRSLLSLSAHEVYEALRGILTYDQQRQLEKLAPDTLQMPTGSNIHIDYEAEGGPSLEVRVQELYGVTTHPTLGPNRTPITLSLLSPAHRPIQITRDLPAFWTGTWAEVRTDMKGRYPRHVWPEDPRVAAPTTRAKPRGT